MSRNFQRALVIAVAMVPAGAISAQTPAAAPAQVDGTRDADRKKILESDRWREAVRRFDEWFAVQTIYSSEKVAMLRSEFSDRVKGMSADELEALLGEMEDRLEVLLSPDAEEARQWISQILVTARDPQSHFGGPLPDVMNMTAGEIRAELQQFQQRRASRQQTQTAFDRRRQEQVQAARDVQSTRREALSQPRTAATFPEPPFRSPYAPQRAPLRALTRPPVYRIGPWGEPIFWDPMDYWRPWRRW